MRSGRLITFEGIDGSGKTTQLQLLATFLRESGYEVVTTREPGGTPLGRQIREALLEGDSESVDPLAELLLYAADRAQHVRRLIRPAIAAGKIVLGDRFCDATIAYQGYGRGFSLDLIHHLNHLATGGLTPDLTLLYDLEVEAGLARTRVRQVQPVVGTNRGQDRLDREPLDFHRRVQAGYQTLLRDHPARLRLIPAAGSVDEIFARTCREVLALLAPATSATPSPATSAPGN